MPDGVDADIEAMKAGGLDATTDGTSANPELTELPDGDHPMLPGREAQPWRSRAQAPVGDFERLDGA